MANIHNRKYIEQLRRKIQKDDEKILELEHRIEALVKSVNEDGETGYK